MGTTLGITAAGCAALDTEHGAGYWAYGRQRAWSFAQSVLAQISARPTLVVALALACRVGLMAVTRTILPLGSDALWMRAGLDLAL